MRLLAMTNPLLIKTSFNRPNLKFTVRDKPSAAKMTSAIKEWINENHPNKSGIIYCLSRMNCEELADKLWKEGIRAARYHGKMPQQEKDDTLRQWQSNDVQVIVATVSE